MVAVTSMSTSSARPLNTHLSSAPLVAERFFFFAFGNIVRFGLGLGLAPAPAPAPPSLARLACAAARLLSVGSDASLFERWRFMGGRAARCPFAFHSHFSAS
jgi:hypothetical protein